MSRRTSGRLSGVSDVYIPQDVDYPSLRLDIDRERAGELGLDQREVVNNVITALTSNQMIAPSFWGRSQERQRLHAHGAVSGESDSQPARPARHPAALRTAERSDAARCRHAHYATDVADGNRPLSNPARHRHLRQPGGRGSGAGSPPGSEASSRARPLPANIRIAMRGMVQGMQASFQSFGLGLILALVPAVSDSWSLSSDRSPTLL